MQRIKGECILMKAIKACKSWNCDPEERKITEEEKSSVIFDTMLLEAYNKIQTVPVWFSSLQSENYCESCTQSDTVGKRLSFIIITFSLKTFCT